MSKRPNYINPPSKIKRVSEVDLKAALKEVNAKNKAFREEMRLSTAQALRDKSFICF